jgi:hypothetical protein
MNSGDKFDAAYCATTVTRSQWIALYRVRVMFLRFMASEWNSRLVG